MVTISVHKACKIQLLAILSLLLLLWGCGGGGGGGGGSSISSNIDSGGSSGSGIGDIGLGDTGSGDSPSDPDATGSVTLSWEAPASNSDGSELNDLAGYKIYYGSSSSNYTNSVDVGNYTSASISSLSSGSWCFATTAYDSSGNESAYSNETCTTI